MTKILTVVGATGSQGSSVINAMLPLASKWSIRAITRSPYSSAGQALQARGVEVIAADLTDAASVKAAFAGSYAIFAMTDFFQPFMAVGLDIARAEEIERTHCVNIIEAAASTTTLEHFIWSTLPPAERNSKHREAGPYDIPHFKGKNQVEDEIKSMPKLLAKTTFVWVGWYASNFQYPIFKPAFMVSTRCADAPVLCPSISNPTVEGGKYAYPDCTHLARHAHQYHWRYEGESRKVHSRHTSTA